MLLSEHQRGQSETPHNDALYLWLHAMLHAVTVFASLLPAGDVQPGQTQPPQCGGDQHHLLGVVAASQPGLRYPDKTLQ